MLYIPLTAAWCVFWLLVVVVSAAGFIAVRSAWVTEPERVPARRAAWTANLTLLLPGAASLVTTASLWGAVVLTVNRALLSRFPTGVHHVVWSPAERPGILFWQARDQLIQQGMGVLPRTLLVLAVAGVMAAWSLAPAIWLEIFPPKDPAKANGGKAEWLGKNLTAGFNGLRVAGEVLRWVAIASTLSLAAFSIYVPQVSVHSIRVDPGFPHFFIPLEKEMVKPAILAGGALVLALFSSRGMLKFLALGFHSALQIAIDVVNWMRFHPLDYNPQARICARFYSLLRYVAEWRDPVDGRGYDSLVIVAHSQGTVITADFLRYLSFLDGTATLQLSQGSPIFKDRKVHLFTMGSPLRQVYSIRFPHVYGWARGTGSSQPFSEPDLVALFGVGTWTNAFRSGDYIGRSLWHRETDELTWSLSLQGAAVASGHREYCVGEGAHTHYWDETAGSVAEELQNLINA
jgi:hypothetical protein